MRHTVFWDVPEGQEPVPMQGFMNHMDTWPVVYGIQGLRDWLFSCKRGSEAEK